MYAVEKGLGHVCSGEGFRACMQWRSAGIGQMTRVATSLSRSTVTACNWGNCYSLSGNLNELVNRVS
jgi:hypothetical protein